jgi:predicted transcriptional regulator
VLKLVHELTAQEQHQLLEQLKFENLRREIQIGIDAADRGELISHEELNKRLDAKHAELVERQKQKK